MQVVVRIIALGVVALLFASPLMACAMETASVSVSEAECCRQMKGDCHDQVGPASHKCCRTISTVPDASQPGRCAAAQSPHVALPAMPVIAPLLSRAASFAAAPDASPPGSPPVGHTTLRI
jgi:hypothetical protein